VIVWSLTSISDHELLSETIELMKMESLSTAQIVNRLGEIEHRRLYADANFGSMRAYCESVLGLSEDEAEKRLHASRAARRFTVLFDALADHRLNLTAINLLAPHVTAENSSPKRAGRPYARCASCSLTDSPSPISKRGSRGWT
jgi:hypothetical protein